jgi:hypothetical protein
MPNDEWILRYVTFDLYFVFLKKNEKHIRKVFSTTSGKTQ